MISCGRHVIWQFLSRAVESFETWSKQRQICTLEELKIEDAKPCHNGVLTCSDFRNVWWGGGLRLVGYLSQARDIHGGRDLPGRSVVRENCYFGTEKDFSNTDTLQQFKTSFTSRTKGFLPTYCESGTLFLYRRVFVKVNYSRITIERPFSWTRQQSA